MKTRIEINPKVMLGKPVIKGTRITVESILRRLSEGQTYEDILKVYPTLEQADIYATLVFASDLIANEEIIVPQIS